MKSRLAEGIAALSLSKAELARRLGVTPPVVGRILAGRLRGRKHVEKIAAILGCSVPWLVTGRGPAPTWAPAPVAEPALGQAQQDAALARVAELEEDRDAWRDAFRNAHAAAAAPIRPQAQVPPSMNRERGAAFRFPEPEEAPAPEREPHGK